MGSNSNYFNEICGAVFLRVSKIVNIRLISIKYTFQVDIGKFKVNSVAAQFEKSNQNLYLNIIEATSDV